jgi:carbon-monoxide dehydrogenase medium subunit
MKPARFVYERPADLAEAIALLAAHGDDARPIAGGQSLMPMLAFRLSAPRVLVDIGRLPGLGAITIGEDATRIGALVRWCDIERDVRLRTAQPLLAAAIRHVAHYQIRNRGTAGGSLAHADPAAELPGIAVTCDAVIHVAGVGGERRIPAGEFFLGPLITALRPGELITGLELPAWPGARRWGFEEFARRQGDFAMAGAAVCYDHDEARRVRRARVGVIGAGNRPLRLAAAEAGLEGRVLEAATIRAAGVAAAAEVDPEDDIHGSGAYRRALVGTLVERALTRSMDA